MLELSKIDNILRVIDNGKINYIPLNNLVVEVQSDNVILKDNNKPIINEYYYFFSNVLGESADTKAQGILKLIGDSKASPLNWVGVFVNNVSYEKNSIVSWNGGLYIAKQITLGESPINKLVWDLFIPFPRNGRDALPYTGKVFEPKIFDVAGQTGNTIIHNLMRDVSVTVYDSDGYIVECIKQKVDENTMYVEFEEPITARILII